MAHLPNVKIHLVNKDNRKDIFEYEGEMIEHFIWPLDNTPKGSESFSNKIYITKEASDEIKKIGNFKGVINGVRYSVKESHTDKDGNKVGLFRFHKNDESSNKWKRLVIEKKK